MNRPLPLTAFLIAVLGLFVAGCDRKLNVEETGGFVLTFDLLDSNASREVSVQDVAAVIRKRLDAEDASRVRVAVSDAGLIEVTVAVPESVRELQNEWDRAAEDLHKADLTFGSVLLAMPDEEGTHHSGTLDDLIADYPDHEAAIRRMADAIEQYDPSPLDDPQVAASLLARMGLLSLRFVPTASSLGVSPEEPDAIDKLIARGECLWFELGWPRSWLWSIVPLDTPAEEVAARIVNDLRRGDFIGRARGASVDLLVSNGADDHLALMPEHLARNAISRIDDDRGRPALMVRFSAGGTELLRRFTTDRIGERLALLHDDRVLLAPTLQSRLGSTLQITGNFRVDELDRLEALIENPLPASLRLVESRIIPAPNGQ